MARSVFFVILIFLMDSYCAFLLAGQSNTVPLTLTSPQKSQIAKESRLDSNLFSSSLSFIYGLLPKTKELANYGTANLFLFKQPLNSHKATSPKYKIFEMSMDVPLGERVLWGAEMAIGKNEGGEINSTKKTDKVRGLRLKPDLYSLKFALKYKI